MSHQASFVIHINVRWSTAKPIVSPNFNCVQTRRIAAQTSFRDARKTLCCVSHIKVVQIIAQLTLERTSSRSRARQTFLFQQRFHFDRRGFARIDQANISTYRFLNSASQNWIVRTTENQRIDTRLQVLQISLGYRSRNLIIRPTLLRQWHEQRTGTFDYNCRRISFVDCFCIRAALYCRFGSANSDPSLGTRTSRPLFVYLSNRGPRSWPNHTDNIDLQCRANRRQSQR